MPANTLIAHPVFILFLFGTAVLVAWTVLRRSRVKDTPNHRSSHSRPTPTTGGLAIVLTFFMGMAGYALAGKPPVIPAPFFSGFTLAALLVAGVSYYDDLKATPFALRLGVQALAIGLVMASGMAITRVDIPLFRFPVMAAAGYGLTFFWILGLTNAYNFMDGLNGMAGCTALVAALFLGIIAFDQGWPFTHMACCVLMAGTAGFLIFNFPGGRLFMGDVGAAFLGFAFAVLALIPALQDAVPISLTVVPLLLFHFIFDTLFTFIRRGLNRENVFKAHRTHIYQLLNQMGAGHTAVTLTYALLGGIQGLAALWMVRLPGAAGLLAFIPFVLAYSLLGLAVVARAKSNNLI